MNNLIIEFIGPNGSGKASVASLVQEGLRERGYPVNLYNLNEWSGSLLYDGSVRMWLRAVRRYMAHSVRCACLAPGAALRLRPLVRKAVLMEELHGSPGACLVDEGPGHTFLRLVASGRISHSGRLVRELEMADIRVYLDADSDELMDRLKGKHEGHWTQRLDVSERVRYLDRYRSYYWSMVHKECRDISIDTRGRKIEEVAALVVDHIVDWSSPESRRLSGGRAS